MSAVEPIAELQAAFANVLARLKEPPRKIVKVVGMALPMGVGQEPPTRLMVFPLGEPVSNDDRKWRFKHADLQAVVADFATRKEPLPIKYAHGKDPAKGERAAGWVDSVELAHDGLYANVHWTDVARAEIRAGEWGFRSPGWDGEEDADGAIHAGPLNEMSLVNDPAIAGMTPVTASTEAVPQEAGKESTMGTTQVAAKTKAAAFDEAGLLQLVRNEWGFPDAVNDESLWGLIEALKGNAKDGPAGDPMMPDGEAKPETPAVPPAPFGASAEDGAKVEASATAQVQTEAADEVQAIKKANADLTARVKALEAQALSGRLITANAADRKSAPVLSFAERVRTERNAALGAAK